MKKRGSKTESEVDLIDRNVEDIALDVKAREDYYDYAVEVIEDRAIYAKIDGLKPVTRRLLWAAHNMSLRSTASFVKAQRVVGETMGNYHPHGDAAIYGALVTAVNQQQGLFEGSGNWGSMTAPAAAPRYTECRLSKYSDKIFFDRFYLNAVHFCPNYDDSKQEPLVLPTLLPNALINGNFGIAPGVRTMTPTFTLQSVVKTLIAALKNGGKADPKTCMHLEFVTDYGGVLRQSSTVKKELLEFYKTGKGRFTFDSVYTDDGKTIRFNRFAPIGNLDGTDGKRGYKPGLLDKIAALPGVDRIYNDTTTSDKYNAYAVEFKKSLSSAARQATIKKIVDLMSGTQSYNVQVVDRRPDPKNPYGFKKLNMSNVPEMITDWITERIALEKRACKFWIGKREEEIQHLNLMRLAVKNRSFIIQALDKKLTDEQLAEYIAKGLKITIEQANTILDLKVRQLKALEDAKLVTKIKELREEIADYIDRIKRPKSFIAKQIVKLGKELAA